MLAASWPNCSAVDFMDSLDSQLPKDWGNDVNYVRMLDYYRQKETAAPEKLKRSDFYRLKCAIDDMLNRGILKASPAGGERTLTGVALGLLVDYLVPRNDDLRRLFESIAAPGKKSAKRAWISYGLATGTPITMFHSARH